MPLLIFHACSNIISLLSFSSVSMESFCFLTINRQFIWSVCVAHAMPVLPQECIWFIYFFPFSGSCFLVHLSDLWTFLEIWIFWMLWCCHSQNQIVSLLRLAWCCCWKMPLFICVVTFPKYFGKDQLPCQNDPCSFCSIISMARNWPDKDYFMSLSSSAHPWILQMWDKILLFYES